jgi:hypothetical protein
MEKVRPQPGEITEGKTHCATDAPIRLSPRSPINDTPVRKASRNKRNRSRRNSLNLFNELNAFGRELLEPPSGTIDRIQIIGKGQSDIGWAIEGSSLP